MLLFALLARWCYLTVDVISTSDSSLNSEWNPYKVLHLDDDGSFDTREIRESYRTLSRKYHPDKVDWNKLAG